MARDSLPPHSPASPPTAWFHVRSRPPPRRSEAFHSPLQGYCAWFLAWRGLWGLGQPHPPQTSLFPSKCPPTAIPSPTPFNSSHRVLDEFPHPGEQTDGLPPLECAMDCAVVSKVGWQLVPLASRTHTEDDGVERLARVCPLATCVLGWIEFCDQPLYLLPEIVGNFPYRLECVLIHHAASPVRPRCDTH